MDKDVTRRSFIKGLAVGTLAGYFASAGFSSTVFKSQLISERPTAKMDIGQLKSVKVKVVSETAWFDNKVMANDIKRGGGALACQYDIDWTTSNTGGYASYIEAELLDGSVKRILVDSGWNPDWTEACFRREGIDKLLANRQLDFMVMTHEHEDHYWGISATLKYWPDIPMYIPAGYYQEGWDLLQGKAFPKANLKNECAYQGKPMIVAPNSVQVLFPGAALMHFDIPIMLRVRGEQAFVFNVKDKGLVLVTGCCHMGIISFLERAKNTIAGGEKIYGIQGGLHVSPFEDWDPQFDDLVLAIKRYGVEKMGCNHCTGYITVEKMLASGLPVIKGTARHRSKRDIYMGNGDEILFG